MAAECRHSTAILSFQYPLCSVSAYFFSSFSTSFQSFFYLFLILQPVFLDPDDILRAALAPSAFSFLSQVFFRLCIRIHTLLVLFLVLLELLDLIHQLFRLFGFVFCFQPV